MDESSSPVKLFYKKHLEIKSYNCVICGKRAGQDVLRSPTEKGNLFPFLCKYWKS